MANYGGNYIMTWDATTPDDSTYLANVIHTQIQADKGMLSERFTGSDGTIEAHNAKDSTDSGIHEASIVGWVKVHADITARDVFSPIKEGTLHFVTDTLELFVVDSTLAYIQIFPADHLELGDKDTGSDHNYQEIDLSANFTGDVKLAALVVNDATGAGDTDPLDETTHAASDWETEHGAASIGPGMVAANVLIGSDVCVKHTWVGAKLVITADTYGLPWHEGDGAESNFCELRVYNDGMAFYRSGAITDGTFACGQFKT